MTYTASFLWGQVEECKNVHIAAYENAYQTACLDPVNIRDTFSLSYELGHYHYTLYFYDRAGNLVQTVPPEGVDESNTSRLDHSNHTYKTQYRYNTLKQLIWQYSPDGGVTEFIYDDKGQLRFSQNAKQRANGTFAYTHYDYLGRITEVGRCDLDALVWSNLEDPAIVDDENFPNEVQHQLSERVITVYSKAYPNPLSGGLIQTYLQNRVSYSYTDKDGNLSTPEDQVTTIYSYNVHGNVSTLIQDVMPSLPVAKDVRQFRIDYDYDLISNKVVEMDYMKGRVDQFFHRYAYDEDNRITQVETSRDGLLWDRDARYEYYTHGPLKRTLIGEDRLQGIDFVYTIQGWLKSINHPTREAHKDPGQDGVGNSQIPKDVFASALTYFQDDFVKPGSPFEFGTFHGTTNTHRDLYNGNITQWSSNSFVDQSLHPDFKYPVWTNRQFNYDELNRLVKSDFFFEDAGWQATDDYDSEYRYDANGNILDLRRNAYEVNGDQVMDKMGYSYNINSTYPNNQLDSITDFAFLSGFSPYDGDIEKTRRYTYDAIGNLETEMSTDPNEPDLFMGWNLMGKLDKVSKSDNSLLSFDYDAGGNRILKYYEDSNQEETYTYYLKDASGNILSIYKLEEDNGAFNIIQKEIPIYGFERVGNLIQDTLAFSFFDPLDPEIFGITSNIGNRKVNDKMYELHDHLENVRLIIYDLKYSLSGLLTIESNQIQEYYPFGSNQKGRYSLSHSTNSFNGNRYDSEFNSTNSVLDFDDRFYYSRIANWQSRDILESSKSSISPYAYGLRNPILYYDRDGNFEIQATETQLKILKSALSNLRTKIMSLPKDSEFLQAIEEYSGLTQEQVVWALDNENGPQLIVADLANYYDFDPINGINRIEPGKDAKPNKYGEILPSNAETSGSIYMNGDIMETNGIVHINDEIVDLLGRTDLSSAEQQEVVEYFESTILHEFVHLGEKKGSIKMPRRMPDGSLEDLDQGKKFERDSRTYGKDVDMNNRSLKIQKIATEKNK